MQILYEKQEVEIDMTFDIKDVKDCVEITLFYRVQIVLKLK